MTDQVNPGAEVEAAPRSPVQLAVDEWWRFRELVAANVRAQLLMVDRIEAAAAGRLSDGRRVITVDETHEWSAP